MRSLSALVLEAFAERGIGVSDVVAGTGLPAQRSPCHSVRAGAGACLCTSACCAGVCRRHCAREAAVTACQGLLERCSSGRRRAGWAVSAAAAAQLLRVRALSRPQGGSEERPHGRQQWTMWCRKPQVRWLFLRGDLFALGVEGALLRKRAPPPLVLEGSASSAAFAQHSPPPQTQLLVQALGAGQWATHALRLSLPAALRLRCCASAAAAAHQHRACHSAACARGGRAGRVDVCPCAPVPPFCPFTASGSQYQRCRLRRCVAQRGIWQRWQRQSAPPGRPAQSGARSGV